MITPEARSSRTVAGRVVAASGGVSEPANPLKLQAPAPVAVATAESGPQIVCDMTDAPDSGPERLAEYARLFEAAYVGRDHDQAGARWLLRADTGIEEWARDLAGRENACCAFMTNTVTRDGDLVIWHMTTTDDQTAKAVLGMFYELPLHRWSTVAEAEDAFDRWSTIGVPIKVRERDALRPATAEEIREGRS